MPITLAEALKREIRRRLTGELLRLYWDAERGPTAAAELYWRGLCPKPTTQLHEPPQYCGEPYDAKSPLGHCTAHIEPDV